MLKQYKSRDPISASNSACVVQSVHTAEQETECDAVVNDFALVCNSDALHNVVKKLCHISSPEREEMIKVITEFTEIFSDVPGRAKCVLNNVDVGNAEPIKQNPYRINPSKLELLRKEVGFMLGHEIIRNLEGCEAYINNVIVFESTWEEYLSRVKELFYLLKEANLTVNLMKSEFGHAHFGHTVGQGQ